MLSAAQTPPEFGMSDTGLSAYSIATLSSNKNSFQLDHNGQFTSFGRYMQAKVSKLMQQVHNDVQRKSALFKGLSFYINGYTNPTSLELRHLIISNGGEYHHYYFSDATTYIVACNLSASKWKTLRANEKVIRPEWIIECVKRNRILPDDVFRLRPPNFIGASLKLISTTTTKTAAQINRLSEQRSALGDRLISTNLCQNSSVQPNITHFFRVRKTPSPNIFSDDGKSTKAAVKSISSPLVLKSHSFEFDAQKTNSTLVKSKYATRKSSRNKLSSIHKDTYRKDASDEIQYEQNELIGSKYPRLLHAKLGMDHGSSMSSGSLRTKISLKGGYSQLAAVCPFYGMKSELPAPSALLGSTDLIAYYDLNGPYSRYCTPKKLREDLASFLPQVCGTSNINAKSDASCSLRKLVESPPITGKEIVGLSASAMIGFKLAPGPVPDHYRFFDLSEGGTQPSSFALSGGLTAEAPPSTSDANNYQEFGRNFNDPEEVKAKHRQKYKHSLDDWDDSEADRKVKKFRGEEKEKEKDKKQKKKKKEKKKKKNAEEETKRVHRKDEGVPFF